MSIKRLLIFILLLSSPPANAMIMEDEARSSLRLYIDSAHIEEASTTQAQRYGGSLQFKAPLPFRLGQQVGKRLGYGLAFNANPDMTKKSGDVNVIQNFYSLDTFLEANYVWLFRFSAFVGPGALLSMTQSNVLNSQESHNQVSGLAVAGLAIDYAISRHWEFGWHFQAQYRFEAEKVDWRQGFGLIFNF
jgi:hypothetical protein